MKRTLVTGATGQIGSDLVRALQQEHDADHIVALDLKPPSRTNGTTNMPHFEAADVRDRDGRRSAPVEGLDARRLPRPDRDALERIICNHEVETVYHLASLLSASGEQHPDRTWDVNMDGLKHVLDLAREYDLKVFWPSSIAVFGADTPKEHTPQETILNPDTMYGVTKRSGELLCRYYHKRFGIDVRSLRYPGLISHAAPPGGGTTDYAVDMLVAAAKNEPYTCFLRPDTRLPMMYMPDALGAVQSLMAADAKALSVRTSYNVAALSFSAEELAAAIQTRCPNFAVSYEPDARQSIADTWPSSVDDTPARTDWDWAPAYDLDAMVEDMLEHLRARERGSVGAREHE